MLFLNLLDRKQFCFFEAWKLGTLLIPRTNHIKEPSISESYYLNLRIRNSILILGSARLEEFWERFRGEEPEHEVFTHDFIDFKHLVPLYVHGDGGRTYRRDELMVMQFQPILGLGSRASNPLKRWQSKPGYNLQGHSFTTRFLTGVIPKTMYESDPQHFDEFVRIAFQDLEQLYYNGFQVGNDCRLRFLVLGVKGDLVFLSKCGHFTRTFLRVRKAPEGANSKPLSGCCWKCAAGTNAMPFEELTLSPAWLNTVGHNNVLPWDTMPPFLEHMPHVISDKGSFFKLDILHIYHLGIGRDFAASSLTMALDRIYVGNIADRLASMNTDLKAFLKASRKQVHFKVLTRDLLGYSSAKVFPSGHWNKAFDTPVLIEFCCWLLQKNEAVLNSDRMLQIIASACGAMTRFMVCLLAAGLWMDQQESLQCGENGLYFLACYAKLADLSYQASLCRYNLVPKLHCFHHVCLDLIYKSRSAQFQMNPISQCTFQDEDFIGRVSRLSRRVSPRLQCLRTIQRYLIATRYQLPEGK